jgi:MFS family permease
MGWFWPEKTRCHWKVRRGLYALLYEGICAQIMGALTGGAFLVAFALSIGASNKVIGLLAAIGPMTQLLQIPSVALVDRLRLRKLITVIAVSLSRIFWIGIALIPFVVPDDLRIPVFLLCLFLFFGIGSVASCSFNSWVRDVVPERIMGRFFSRRLAISTAVAAAVSIAGAVIVDLFATGGQINSKIYSALFLVGAVCGLGGALFFKRVPEPHLESTPGDGLLPLLKKPFKHKNFRALLVFLGMWNFAVNLAAPFFTVFLLKELRMSMAWVLALSILSQVVNVAFLRIWGKLADRFSNKSILAVSGPLFMISIILWPFTTMPERYAGTIPLVILIHVLAGISTAGVTLCAGNIAMVSAPKGEATAYLAVNAIVSGIAAAIAPIIAGISADFFTLKELSVDIRMGDLGLEANRFAVYALNLRGLDFLFFFSFLFGILALERLVAIHETGHVKKRVVVNEFFGEVRKMTRNISNVAGLRQLTYFPYNRLRDLLKRRPATESP